MGTPANPPTSAARTPAIVMGRGYTALGALRSLVAAGIPAYVACPPDDLVTRSRWYRPTPGATRWNGTVGPHALEILRAMPLTRAVLIPCADDIALWLSSIAGTDLADRFRVSSSPRESLEILQDKSRFGAFLARHGIAHPRTYPISTLADIGAIPFEELDRVFIKPADSQSFSQILGAKGIWATTRDEFETIWRRLDSEGFKVIAQEYVPGSAADHYFVDGFRDRNGGLAGLFARKRSRLHPADFGNSSYCESIPLADVGEAVDSITALLERLRYRGIFSAEFKRDSRNGTFRILEVNTRAWWYVEFAARCGINVCAMTVDDANDLPLPPSPRDYRTGVGCVNLLEDIKAVRAQPSAVRMPLSRLLRQWSGAYFHVFRLADPGPSLSILWRKLWQKTRGIVSRIIAPEARPDVSRE